MDTLTSLYQGPTALDVLAPASYYWRKWACRSAFKSDQRKRLFACLLTWRHNILLKALRLWMRSLSIDRKNLIKAAISALNANSKKCRKRRRINNCAAKIFQAYIVFTLSMFAFSWTSITASSQMCRRNRLSRSLLSFHKQRTRSREKFERLQHAKWFWFGCVYTRIFHMWCTIHWTIQTNRKTGVYSLRAWGESIFFDRLANFAVSILRAWKKSTKSRLLARVKIQFWKEKLLCRSFVIIFKIVKSTRAYHDKSFLMSKMRCKRLLRALVIAWMREMTCGRALLRRFTRLKRGTLHAFLKKACSRHQKRIKYESASNFFCVHCQPRMKYKAFQEFRIAVRFLVKEQSLIEEIMIKHNDGYKKKFISDWKSVCLLLERTAALTKWECITELSARVAHLHTLSKTIFRRWLISMKAEKIFKIISRGLALNMFMKACALSAANRARASIALLAGSRNIMLRFFGAWSMSKPVVTCETFSLCAFNLPQTRSFLYLAEQTGAEVPGEMGFRRCGDVSEGQLRTGLGGRSGVNVESQPASRPAVAHGRDSKDLAELSCWVEIKESKSQAESSDQIEAFADRWSLERTHFDRWYFACGLTQPGCNEYQINHNDDASCKSNSPWNRETHHGSSSLPETHVLPATAAAGAARLADDVFSAFVAGSAVPARSARRVTLVCSGHQRGVDGLHPPPAVCSHHAPDLLGCVAPASRREWRSPFARRPTHALHRRRVAPGAGLLVAAGAAERRRVCSDGAMAGAEGTASSAPFSACLLDAEARKLSKGPSACLRNVAELRRRRRMLVDCLGKWMRVAAQQPFPQQVDA